MYKKEIFIMNLEKTFDYITPSEYEKLQDTYNCKTEYANGEIWFHSNASDKHNDIIVNLSTYINLYLKGSPCKVKTEGMEVIFDENEKYKLKPDLFIVCKNDIDNMKGESFTTPPKVIFEVVSPGKLSIKRDKQYKYNIYEHYGVLEYNIVEQNGYIHQHALIDGYYQLINSYHFGDEYKGFIFEDLKVKLEDIFNS